MAKARIGLETLDEAASWRAAQQLVSSRRHRRASGLTRSLDVSATHPGGGDLAALRFFLAMVAAGETMLIRTTS